MEEQRERRKPARMRQGRRREGLGAGKDPRRMAAA